MKFLIILRGPAGSGKSTVCTYLRDKIGRERTCSLDLDITGVDDDKFNENLTKCLAVDYVVGMMYYGNSHTEQPQRWISKLKERNYRILSVVLNARMDVCYERCKNDVNPERDPINKEKIKVNSYYSDFDRRQRENIFQKRAGIEEIVVDTEKKSQGEVGDEILRHLNIL